MANTPTAAMTAEDEAKVRAILERHSYPPNVRGWELEFTNDWSGDPVVYILFRVDDALDPSEQTVREVRQFSDDLSDELLGADLHHFPHFRYQPPVEATIRQPSKRRR